MDLIVEDIIQKKKTEMSIDFLGRHVYTLCRVLVQPEN